MTLKVLNGERLLSKAPMVLVLKIAYWKPSVVLCLEQGGLFE